MPYSARALGHQSFRLRSRRARSDRSHRLSVRFAVALMVLASLAGLVGATLQTRLSPVADAAAVDEQLYVTALWIIQNQVDEGALHLGVIAAQYAQGEIDRTELATRLDDDLATLRRVDDQ